MARRLTDSLLCLLLAATASAGAADGVFGFDAGADARIRQEIMDHVAGLPAGGRLLASPRSDDINHMRFRTRVWGEVTAAGETAGAWRLYTRLTDECRWYVHPDHGRFTFPDEVVLDNLFLEAKGLFDGRVDGAIGRQDIYNLYGLDHVFVDGTPGDGSRDIYSDMVRLGFKVSEESRIDVFGLYNCDDNPIRWGTHRGKHRTLSGLGGGAELDMDDWGFGVIWSSRLAPFLPYQLFAIQKETAAYDLKGVKRPHTRRETFGAKTVPQLTDEWSLQFEGMGQVGENGADETLTGWSAYAGANWKASGTGLRPFAKIGYHFMSGDEDAAGEDGGHSAWDPLWARAVNDSEMFLYGTHYGPGYWSNMHYVKLTSGLDFGRCHQLLGSCGPLFAAAKDGMGGGEGAFKGFLSQAKYSFPLWLPEKGSRFMAFGHVLAEFFNPGDYYETDKPAWFVRWQVEIKF